MKLTLGSLRRGEKLHIFSLLRIYWSAPSTLPAPITLKCGRLKDQCVHVLLNTRVAKLHNTVVCACAPSTSSTKVTWWSWKFMKVHEGSQLMYHIVSTHVIQLHNNNTIHNNCDSTHNTHSFSLTLSITLSLSIFTFSWNCKLNNSRYLRFHFRTIKVTYLSQLVVW